MTSNKIIWPCELTSSFKEILLRSARSHALDHEHHMDFGKDRGNGLFYVAEGLVILGRHESTNTSPFFVFKAGDWFGALLVYRKPDFIYQLSSPDYSKILFIPDHAVRDIATNHPELYKFLYYMDLDRSIETVDMLWVTACMERAQRVAYFLLMLSERFPKVTGSNPMISMSQTMLAKILGLSRISLNQELRLLESKKIISTDWKKIHITDAPALEALIKINPAK